MISRPTLGLIEDLIHLASPRNIRESARHLRTGLLFAGSGAGGFKGFAKNVGHSLRAPWDLGFRGGLITTLPLAAYMTTQAPSGSAASTLAGNLVAPGLSMAPGALLGGSLGGWVS